MPETAHKRRRPQRGHLRFIGATIYCPRAERRVKIKPDHKHGEAFTCPGCGVRVEETGR